MERDIQLYQTVPVAVPSIFFFSRCELFASRAFQKEGQLIKLWSRNLLTAQNKFKANGL